MSTTTVTSAQAPGEAGPRTATMMNGKTFTFQSNVSTTLAKIPIIDAARIWSQDLAERKALAEEIREAAHEIGFFYLVNHGIDMKYADEAMTQAKRFFAMPQEKKMEVFTGLVPNEYVGFHPMECYNRNGWKRQDLSEAFNWGYDAKFDPDATPAALAQKSPSIWPSDLPGFQEGVMAYHAQLLRFSRRLARIFALALHMPEDYFDAYTAQPEAGMRILHYPEQEHSVDEQNGIGAHTDVESFTIVTQDDTGGLEVLGKDGHWIKATPVPGAFVVNIADCFMRQTNDFFVSTIHRVVNKSGRERYSVPFFFGFDRSMRLDPIPSCVDETKGMPPMKYPVITAGEYYEWRTNRQKKTNTFNEEVQGKAS
ncbi:uncharacterized protein B0I36DRAFT_328598 [Microdochium trichocladiopsis]|uniref:Fe2OG dioxygenase domain-containing protein n=1 Tax=Microdochium trichocladiopsis TaxID=1682393 RepID=A0A9P9BNU4_9PEZI|nr:uncharacterized protein B0I36DRAFT_328598 [Microdochium trichocladiopsis]KAH7028091.1 hypothetical protein B0I36DRAFT_328598 [Microdochium trichocladiopsis]